MHCGDESECALFACDEAGEGAFINPAACVQVGLLIYYEKRSVWRPFHASASDRGAAAAAAARSAELSENTPMQMWRILHSAGLQSVTTRFIFCSPPKWRALLWSH